MFASYLFQSGFRFYYGTFKKNTCLFLTKNRLGQVCSSEYYCVKERSTFNEFHRKVLKMSIYIYDKQLSIFHPIPSHFSYIVVNNCLKLWLVSGLSQYRTIFFGFEHTQRHTTVIKYKPFFSISETHQVMELSWKISRQKN